MARFLDRGGQPVDAPFERVKDRGKALPRQAASAGDGRIFAVARDNVGEALFIAHDMPALHDMHIEVAEQIGRIGPDDGRNGQAALGGFLRGVGMAGDKGGQFLLAGFPEQFGPVEGVKTRPGDGRMVSEIVPQNGQNELLAPFLG